MIVWQAASLLLLSLHTRSIGPSPSTTLIWQQTNAIALTSGICEPAEPLHECATTSSGSNNASKYRQAVHACPPHLEPLTCQAHSAGLLQQSQALLELRIAEPSKALLGSGLPAAQVHRAVLDPIRTLKATSCTQTSASSSVCPFLIQAHLCLQDPVLS